MVTRHLTAEQLVDGAEGSSSPAALSHVNRCEECRRRVAALQSTITAVAGSEVPEPSPLFWGHLSARVLDAVEEERRREAGATWSGVWSRFGTRSAWVAAAAALVVSIGLICRTKDPTPSVAPSTAVSTTASVSDVPSLSDDPSLSLVADLAGDLDWESAREAGFMTGAGADDAVNQLTEGERRELGRLLRGELAPARPGA